MKPRHLLPGIGSVPYRRDGGKDPDQMAALKTQLKSMKEQVEASHSKVEEWLAKAAEQIKANAAMSDDVKVQLAEATANAKSALAQMTEVQDELIRLRSSPESRKGGMPSLYEAVTTGEVGERFKSFATGNANKFVMQVKDITEATTGSGDAGTIIRPDRVQEIIRQPDRILTVRDMLGAASTGVNAIEYVRETGFTNAAAPVAEGNLKPQSDLTFELLTSTVRTIAHLFVASVQVLEDVPQLQSYLDDRLRYGLREEIEDQLLSGDGTGQNLLGLIPQATPFDTSRKKVGDTRIDIIRRAMTQVRLAEYRADGIMMHPTDWEEIELTKGTDDHYIWANPSSPLQPRLWGLPVVESTSLEEGEFLIGAFQRAATVFDSHDARVEMATQDVDNFRRNMVTLRGEERLALCVFRPEALVYGDFDDIVSA